MITTWYSETLDEHNEYLKIFKRWQNYAVDGTIFGIAVSPTLMVIPDTPVAELVNKELFFLNEDKPEAIKPMLWVNPKNQNLDMKEKFRRSLAIIEEANQYNWNIVNKQNKLNELKAAIKNYLN